MTPYIVDDYSTITVAPLTIAETVKACEDVADKISDGIKAAMPCDCREQGSRVRCGACGREVEREPQARA